jgi:hypothetical protein
MLRRCVPPPCLGWLASSSSTYVVVYDPSAGFVTGNGRIISPVGAYAPNPALSGKATFGFVSKYKNGKNVPTGNTDFQFKLANFNFKSTSYEWLVVSGAKARLRGVGTVNGVGDYGFELTAIDGQENGGGGADKFRIKIWQGNQGNGVIYDNMPGATDGDDPTTTLDGGNIVIHKNSKPPMASLGGSLNTGVGSLTQETLNQAVDQAVEYWRSMGSLPLDATRRSTLGMVRLPNEEVAEIQARDQLFARLDNSPAKQLARSPIIASDSPNDEPRKPASAADDLPVRKRHREHEWLEMGRAD